VHHIAVVVSDLARAEAFYSGVLGLPVLRRHDDAAGRPRAVWLGLRGEAEADGFLALERSDATAAAPDATAGTPDATAAAPDATAGTPDAATRADAAPGWHCVALGIARADRDTWRARLAAAGHPVERESAYTLYARDPDGALVALSHWPDAA
jgi:catechol 2,3-dioxygenase-like lactoylglutathione lyase family enzyme